MQSEINRRKLVLVCCISGLFVMNFLKTEVSHATDVKSIATFKDWSTHLIVKNKVRICYLHGEPNKMQGKYKRRGKTYVQVAHRTRPKTRNEVSITAGYLFKKNSKVLLTIDGRKYNFFTDAGTAWADEENSDNAVVSAMRAGRKMIIRGISSRGTRTTDTYSLSGFTAAHKSINKACGFK